MTTPEEEERRCPICGERVIHVKETDETVRTRIKCESEYFIHYADRLIKIKTPHDPAVDSPVA